MAIVDVHAHLMSSNFTPKSYWDSWISLSSQLSGKPTALIEKRMPEFWDETGELLIKDMDVAGVDQSWISVLDYGLSKTGEAHYSVEEQNRLYAEIAQGSRNRLIAFFGIDPRRDGAIKLLETGVNEWGLKGLKLLPAAGFYPNSEECRDLYAKAMELGIPVLVHTGPEILPFYSKFCYPVFLDEVANDFPELTLILAHAGFCWWQEALNIASTKPNVYLDLAGWQPKTRRHPIEEFYKPLRIMIDTIGPSRILFGSDWPALRLFGGGESSWVRSFTEPPESVREAGITFTKAEIDAILGQNAARLLNKEYKERQR
ncbi:MAG: amidohydrolase family protein [Dehalococcoidales bacterium]|jgi:hypothetical protein|nr:amidohydrolase family protein [Dehalococcoidales bacterium]